MTLQIEIEFGRMNHVTIHDGASRAISAPICDARRREETNVMTFSDNNDGDLRINTGLLACPYESRMSKRYICTESGSNRPWIRGSSFSRTCLNCPSETPSLKKIMRFGA